mgnify:CR=1 FL=1
MVYRGNNLLELSSKLRNIKLKELEEVLLEANRHISHCKALAVEIKDYYQDDTQ